MKKLNNILSKIRIKKDKLERTLEWAKELQSREDEVFETLRNEGVFLENVFVEEINDDEVYLYFYMKIENLQKNREVINKSILPIDIYHKAYKKESWAEVKLLKELLNFDRLADFYNNETKPNN